MKPLYRLNYRNLSHARIDFTEFLKELNIHIKKNIPKEHWFTVKLKDHFLDRLMDRKADPNYIKKIIRDAFNRKLCEIIYFKNNPDKLNNRICFTDSVNHVFLSCDLDSNSFTLRTFVQNGDRKESLLNPEFTIKPFSKLIGDEYAI